jgi:hypothetical protein
MSNLVIDYDDASHIYKINGEEVPSVTQLLDATTPKPALTWWGMRVGLSAVIKLLQLNKLSSMALPTYDYEDHLSGKPLNGEAVWRGKGRFRKAKTPLEALVIENKLSTNHIRDTKADLGTVVHDAIQKITASGDLPALSEYDEEVRGYLRALSRWWFEQSPIIVEQEVIVASLQHRYAGRYDCIVEIDDRVGLIDFKTSGGIYESYSEQLALYELAHLEMGGDPFDFTAIVWLSPEGDYEQRDTYTSAETAEAIAALYWRRQDDELRKGSAWKGK